MSLLCPALAPPDPAGVGSICPGAELQILTSPFTSYDLNLDHITELVMWSLAHITEGCLCYSLA